MLNFKWGARVGVSAVVSRFAFPQCSLGSIPGEDVLYGFSISPRGFSTGARFSARQIDYHLYFVFNCVSGSYSSQGS